jgi:hypothetical protein
MFLREDGAGTATTPDPVSARVVSGTYFETLGVRALFGRTIEPTDDQVRDSHPVVVLSFEYWQRRFAGDHLEAPSSRRTGRRTVPGLARGDVG